MDRQILLNPGPVTLSQGVRQAMTRGDWCHREPEFARLTGRINDGLASVYEEMVPEYRAVMMTGSGTAAVEAMLATFAPAQSGTLVVANGVYGERMARILQAHGREHSIMKFPWDAAPNPVAVERALEDNPTLTHVALVHHETTTGRLNDLDSLGAVCRRLDRQLLLDAVSSFGAEAMNPEGWNLAALAAGANKCLHGVPGIAFVLAPVNRWSEERPEPVSVYLDLKAYYEGQHGQGFSPFTQAVQPAFALEVALNELQEEGGWQARQTSYRARAQRIHDFLAARGVEPLLADAETSCVLRSYRLPEGMNYASLHDPLKKKGFVIYAGQGDYSAEIFRLSFMGDIRDSDLQQLEHALDQLL